MFLLLALLLVNFLIIVAGAITTAISIQATGISRAKKTIGPLIRDLAGRSIIGASILPEFVKILRIFA